MLSSDAVYVLEEPFRLDRAGYGRIRQTAGDEPIPILAQELLHTLSEVSVAFAGFSGVVGVFGGGSQLSAEERSFRIRELISLGLAALFASLLPLVLAQFIEAESVVWLVSCAALAAYYSYSLLAIRRKVRQLGDRLPKSRTATVVNILHPCVVLALALGALRVLPPHAVYIAGIVWALVLGARHFALLVARTNPRFAV